MMPEQTSNFVHSDNPQLAGLSGSDDRAGNRYKALGYKLDGQKFDHSLHTTLQYVIWGGIGLAALAALYGSKTAYEKYNRNQA